MGENPDDNPHPPRFQLRGGKNSPNAHRPTRVVFAVQRGLLYLRATCLGLLGDVWALNG